MKPFEYASPETEREAWLAELARSQPQLQPALRELLARHAKGETGDFLKGLAYRGDLSRARS